MGAQHVKGKPGWVEQETSPCHKVASTTSKQRPNKNRSRETTGCPRPVSRASMRPGQNTHTERRCRPRRCTNHIASQSPRYEALAHVRPGVPSAGKPNFEHQQRAPTTHQRHRAQHQKADESTPSDKICNPSLDPSQLRAREAAHVREQNRCSLYLTRKHNRGRRIRSSTREVPTSLAPLALPVAPPALDNLIVVLSTGDGGHSPRQVRLTAGPAQWSNLFMNTAKDFDHWEVSAATHDSGVATQFQIMTHEHIEWSTQNESGYIVYNAKELDSYLTENGSSSKDSLAITCSLVAPKRRKLRTAFIDPST